MNQTKNNILISIVSPVYLGEQSLVELSKQIIHAVEPITNQFEIIYVEDHSPDHSWQVIEELCHQDKRIKGIKLARNFGQHAATTAAFKAAKGQYVIVLDCDLQDDPKYIAQLYQHAQCGFDIVFTHMKKRSHSYFRNKCARLYYAINDWLAGGTSNIGLEANNYVLISRKVIDAFLRLKEKHRHNLMILKWMGYTSTSIPIEHRHRPYGQSSYTFKKLIAHAINGITAQSSRLLAISIGIGFLSCFLSFSGAFYLVISYFIKHHLAGWTSVMVLMLLCTGVILICLGIVGLYIGKIFEEVKDRPIYFIDKQLNLEAGSESLH